MTKNIFVSNQDVHAVVFFNTSKAKNDLDFSHIYVLQDLDKPGADRISALESLGKNILKFCFSLLKSSVKFKLRHQSLKNKLR